MAYENDYLSPLKSDEDKAWERKLFAPATGRDPAPAGADEHRDVAPAGANKHRDAVPAGTDVSRANAPPGTADPAEFFEEIIKHISDRSKGIFREYQNCQFSNPRKASIGEHNVTYLEAAYEDRYRNEYVDVFSIEKKPLGAAFIVEYRYRPGEYENGKEALSRVYETLTFLQDDFKHIDASRMRFSMSRVYGKENRYAALIDVSDLEDLIQSRVYRASRVSFSFGRDADQPSIELTSGGF